LEGHALDISAFLGALLLLLVVAKIGAEIAERLGQPSVLGEIVAGVLVGATGLGLLVRGLDASGAAVFQVFGLRGGIAASTYGGLDALAEIGAIVLLFEIGLHTDLYELRKVGSSALWVGFAGVVLPFVGGWWVAQHLLGLPAFTSLVIGAALTATSVGITARVFQDLNMLHTAESQVVLGAAVADDVIGLVILAVISALGTSAMAGGSSGAGESLWWLGFKVTLGAVGFLVAAVWLGVQTVPFIDRTVKGLRSRGSITVLALAFCLMMALLGEQFRLAFIIGAFAAGLVLSHCECQKAIQDGIKPLADIFIPLFFAMMGTVVNLRVLVSGGQIQWGLIGMTLALVVVAVVGKVAGCLTVPDKRLNKVIVGLAMIPRGEVGLIYARLGLSHGWLRESAYDSVVLMVIFTTLMTPPLLRMVARSKGGKIAPHEATLDRDDWETFDAGDMMQTPATPAPNPVARTE
jgi:Kef-type K+ transport system membrane component KefB